MSTPMIDSQELLDEVLGTPRYDPLEFCNHIQGQVKKLMLKMVRRDIEREITEEQRQRERMVQMGQLDAIVRLIALQQQSNQAKVVDDADEEEKKSSLNRSARNINVIREQMKMYIE